MTQKVISTNTVPYTALGEQVEPIRQELVTRVDEVITRVTEIAQTGRMGDGKIFQLPATTHEAIIDIAEG